MDLIDVRHLAALVRERWPAPTPGDDEGDIVHPLPEPAVLEQLLAVCCRASLMREELRPVVFRLILCPSHLLPADAGPPLGLHRLVFSEPRPCSAHELRRLSPAATYHRGLIGAPFTMPSGACEHLGRRAFRAALAARSPGGPRCRAALASGSGDPRHGARPAQRQPGAVGCWPPSIIRGLRHAAVQCVRSEVALRTLRGSPRRIARIAQSRACLARTALGPARGEPFTSLGPAGDEAADCHGARRRTRRHAADRSRPQCASSRGEAMPISD